MVEGFFTDFMPPHPYGGFSGVAVRGLYRCFWAMGYNLRFFMGVLRFFYGFLCLFMVDFAQVLGWARCEFTDIYGLFAFFMVFLWFFYAFHGFSTDFYG